MRLAPGLQMTTSAMLNLEGYVYKKASAFSDCKARRKHVSDKDGVDSLS